MKSLLAAALIALPLAMTSFGASAPAEASTSVRVFFGVPYYAYQVAPDYRFRAGYGWYRYAAPARLTCGQAANVVWRHGFNRPVALDCRGATYVFRAWRFGRPHRLYVNSVNGRIWGA